jgi:RNA polymerase sigma factor (sigma-70 family)
MRQDSHKIEDRLLLKKACHEACRESLSIIFQRYREPVCDFLHKTGADGRAADICQSVFMHIHQGKCNYDGSSDANSYLFGIARNLLKQEIKSEKAETYGIKGMAIQGAVLGRQGTQESPVNTLERTETRQALEKKILQLSPHAQLAVKLVFLDGIPAKEAAKIAKCDFKAFRKRLRHGLKNLEKEFSRKSLLNSRLWVL